MSAEAEAGARPEPGVAAEAGARALADNGEALRDAVAQIVGGTVVAWEPLVSGNSRTTWSADVRRDGELLALVARTDGGDGPFSDTPLTLAREAAFYHAVQGRGVPIPAIHGFDERLNMVVLSRAAGEPAWDGAILAALLRELRELHAIDADTVAISDVGRSARAELELWADIAATRIAPPSAYVDFALDFLRARFPGEPPKLALVHGDPGPGNLLWQDGRITALLDWEMSHFGDPLDDLAFLTVRAAMFGLPLERFAEQVRDHYARAAGELDERRLRYWQAVSVLRNLIICLSSVSNPVRGRDRLVHWMLIPSLNLLLMRALAVLDGIALAPTPPTPAVGELPGGEVIREIAAELGELVGAIEDPERRQRARRARYLLAQLAETWPHAFEIAREQSDAGAEMGAGERLLELGARADRELRLFPRARALGEAMLPGFS
jgi:aminoglycoside phosphotransferase (APT) family kinase protein